MPGVGIDEKKFDIKMTKADKHKLRKELGLKDTDFVMIYPAEISKRKRQLWLIDAVRELLQKNMDIHLLLPGRDSLNGKCQELIKKYNLEKQIHILGFRNDIPKLLMISNLSISSSKQEGLPVNIMEAMYVGLPTVVTDCRGNRDLIKNNQNGFNIPIDNQQAFSKAISKIYLNRNIIKKMKEENQKNIQNYMLPNIITRMEIIYKEKQVI